MDEKYKLIMGLDDGTKAIDGSQVFRALERAHDIRKFEIDLYWKRSSQMYVIVAALLTAFGLLVSNNAFLGATAIACLGTIVSFAWVHVNKGSKFWQENWEAHIDILEDSVEGALYKVVNVTKEKEYAYSVSKINMTVSWIITWCWFATATSMIIFTANRGIKTDNQDYVNWLQEKNITIVIAIFTIVCLIYIACKDIHGSNLVGKAKFIGKYKFKKRDITKWGDSK